MAKLVINGQQKLKGTVNLSGDQGIINAIQAASLLATSGTLIIDNVPLTERVQSMNTVLKSLNVITQYDTEKQILKMDATRHLKTQKLINDQLILAGPLLARCRKIVLLDKGVNNIHTKNTYDIANYLAKFGNKIESSDQGLLITASNPHSNTVNMENASLLTTISLILFSTLVPGISVFKNVSKNLEIYELALVLNKMGARVHGAGTNTIRVQGVTFLHSTDYFAIADQAEAAVFLAAGALTAGDVFIQGAQEKYLKTVLSFLEKTGNTIVVQHNGIRVIGTKVLISPSSLELNYSRTEVNLALLAVALQSHGMMSINQLSADLKNILTSVKLDQQYSITGNSMVVDHIFSALPQHIRVNNSVEGLFAVLNGLSINQTTTIEPAELVGEAFQNFVDQLLNLNAKIHLSFE